MAFNSNITPGNPPLLWSNIDEAFRQINQNFDEIVAATGLGITPVNFETLDTNVSPTVSNTYSLGSGTNKWRNVYTEEWSSVGINSLNGVWLGSAQIKGISGKVDLPSGSTVGGNLIIDPDKTFFKSAQVDNGDRVEANEFNDTLNFLSGNGIALTVGSPGESITITNDGIVNINGIDGITATTVAGTTTISNAGVRSLQNIGSLPSGRTVGAGIFIDNATGPNIKITNTGILGFDNSGFGINVSVDAATGLATVNLSTGVVTTAAFRNIGVTGTAGQPTVSADTPADTLTLNAGYGIIINSSDDPEVISFSVDPEIDIKGSIVGNDSTVIVDAEDRKVYADLIGNVTGNVTGGTISATTLRTSEQKITLGNLAGETVQGSNAVAIGREAGRTTQGAQAVAIGGLTGQTSQGDSAVAIGVLSGQASQGVSAVAIGNQAGQTTQGIASVAIGAQAGETSQGSIAVAIGQNAGEANQGSSGVAIGYYAGKDTQGTGAVALGYTTAQVTQGQAGVAIGWSAGQTNQGAYAIAIGYRAGFTNQNASSIVLNASGAALEAAAAGFFVNPVRPNANGRPLIYNTATSELSYSSVLEFIGNTISTSDSSSITVDVLTTFNSDIVVENDVRIRGSKVLNLQELKEIVAASTSFSNFQARIAAL